MKILVIGSNRSESDGAVARALSHTLEELFEADKAQVMVVFEHAGVEEAMGRAEPGRPWDVAFACHAHLAPELDVLIRRFPRIALVMCTGGDLRDAARVCPAETTVLEKPAANWRIRRAVEAAIAATFFYR